VAVQIPAGFPLQVAERIFSGLRASGERLAAQAP
jgi:hypothetical protein